MTEMKWTPGPWATDGLLIYADHGIQLHIASVMDEAGHPYAGDAAEANASLIAAATEMAEALRAARVQIDFWKKTAANATGNLMPHIVPAESVIEQIDSALQKAGG